MACSGRNKVIDGIGKCKGREGEMQEGRKRKAEWDGGREEETSLGVEATFYLQMAADRFLII